MSLSHDQLWLLSCFLSAPVFPISWIKPSFSLFIFNVVRIVFHNSTTHLIALKVKKDIIKLENMNFLSAHKHKANRNMNDIHVLSKRSKAITDEKSSFPDWYGRTNDTISKDHNICSCNFIKLVKILWQWKTLFYLPQRKPLN